MLPADPWPLLFPVFSRGTGKGVEFSATWSDGPLSAWGNLAIAKLDGRQIVGGQASFTAAQLAAAAGHDIAGNSDQRIAGSAGLAWRTGPLRLSGDIAFGSGLPRSGALDAPNSASLPAWSTVNLAAVYRVQGLGHRPLDIRLDVLNAFDQSQKLQDGTSLMGGTALWRPRRGIFVGLEQEL